ncbi:hypothetical protein B0H11DRAFT_2228785 [Mycena galericulata]|nr:hypothetical protein B0H11DRAFT_2228785 [Mycena galericulata]
MQLSKSLLLVQDFRGFCALNVQDLQALDYPSAPALPISTFLLIFSDRGSRAGQHVDDQPPTPFSNANTNAPPQHAHTQEPYAVRAHPLDAPMRATSRMAVPTILKKWLHSAVFADNAYSMLTGGNCVFVLAVRVSTQAWKYLN